MTLSGKFVFRDLCERKLPWDTPIPADLEKDWKKWSLHLPQFVSVKRTIAPFREAINSIQLHSFGDASSKGVCAAVYAVVNQESGTTQGLVTSKSRLSKKSLTIPRLELVAGHMAVNLAVNVRDTLQDCNPVVYCWLDSTVRPLLDTRKWRIPPVRCKPSAKDPAASGYCLASCTNRSEPRRPGK